MDSAKGGTQGTGLTARHHGGEQLAAISGRVVRLLRESIGQGPTRCRTHWAGADIVLVELEGGFSAAEQTLADFGRSAEVHTSRAALQESMAGQMRDIVRSETGREVRVSLSAGHMDPDITVQIFMLETRLGGTDQ